MLTEPHFSKRPLYLQVRDLLVQRIVAGDWKPGAAIPNELELAQSLGVSPGTMRKALDTLEAEHLLSRQQGRGTFVLDHSSDELAVRFSNIRGADGHRITGTPVSVALSFGEATELEQRRLWLKTGAPVIRMQRMRTQGEVPFMDEQVSLPRALFPDVRDVSSVPLRIAVLAQRHGIILSRAEERLNVAAATKDVAQRLALPDGAPLLQLDRIVYDIDGRPVEWRSAHCHLGEKYYLSIME